MTKSLFITSSQVTAICKGAQKAGFIAEIEVDGVLIRLLPGDNLKEKLTSSPTGYDEDMPIL